MRSARATVRNLRSLSGKTYGNLHITASQTIANYWLPQRLATFHSRNPEVMLNVTMSNTRDVEQAVLKGDANIGFVEGEITSDKLELIEVDHDQPLIVASAKRWSSFGMARNYIDPKLYHGLLGRRVQALAKYLKILFIRAIWTGAVRHHSGVAEQ